MTPERPAFFEGQILAAADLTSAVDYGRAQAARHDRYLHAWGIAEGLELTTVQNRCQRRKICRGHARARRGDRRYRPRDRRAGAGPAQHGGFLQRQRRLAAGRSELPDSAARNRHRPACGTADHRRLRARQPADSYPGGVRPDLRRPRRRAFPRRTEGTGRERWSRTRWRAAVGDPGRFRPVGRFGPEVHRRDRRRTTLRRGHGRHRRRPERHPGAAVPGRPPHPVSPCWWSAATRQGSRSACTRAAAMSIPG